MSKVKDMLIDFQEKHGRNPDGLEKCVIYCKPGQLLYNEYNKGKPGYIKEEDQPKYKY